MKKFLLGVAVIIIGVFALGKEARADEGDLVANIDHDFIASGAAHSAGKYKVYRLSPETLMLRSEESRSSFFLPVIMRGDAALDRQLGLKLILSGDVYYLSEVSTSRGIYTLSVPRVVTRMVDSKTHNTMAGSGSK